MLVSVNVIQSFLQIQRHTVGCLLIIYPSLLKAREILLRSKKGNTIQLYRITLLLI